MRSAVLLALIGLAFVALAILLVTTGGCRVEDCGLSINQIALLAGLGCVGGALIRAILVASRARSNQ